jgi:hypothetical protein
LSLFDSRLSICYDPAKYQALSHNNPQEAEA